jgi:hypothetical protein
VNDLFYTASATVRSLFREDVESWLSLADIRFLRNVPFIGKTGYAHQFDFAIPPSKKAPERLIKAITNPSKDAAESMIFSWLDTRDVRPSESVAVAFLNDQDHAVPASVLEALRHYQIEAIPWTRREDNRQKLAA